MPERLFTPLCNTLAKLGKLVSREQTDMCVGLVAGFWKLVQDMLKLSAKRNTTIWVKHCTRSFFFRLH